MEEEIAEISERNLWGHVYAVSPLWPPYLLELRVLTKALPRGGRNLGSGYRT